MPQSDIHPLAPRQNHPIDPLNDDNLLLTSVLRETIQNEGDMGISCAPPEKTGTPPIASVVTES